jgi:hypothetical protein
MQSLDSHTLPYFYHGILAFFGAVVHALEANRKGETKSFKDFISLVFMSSFSGVIFALVALQLIPEQEYLTAAIAGTGGYVGVEGMSLALPFIKQKLGIK